MTRSSNPIIAIAKETWDPGDTHSCSAEWLFQVCRLWTEHQDVHTGTCPVDYRDPGGPVGFGESRYTGEDTAYWDAVFALLDEQGIIDTPWDGEDSAYFSHLWQMGDPIEGYDPHRAFEHIRVALKVFDRIFEITKED